jgi:hypothetical protein
MFASGRADDNELCTKDLNMCAEAILLVVDNAQDEKRIHVYILCIWKTASKLLCRQFNEKNMAGIKKKRSKECRSM